MRAGAPANQTTSSGSRSTPRCSPRAITFPTDAKNCCMRRSRGSIALGPPAWGAAAAVISAASPRRAAMMAGALCPCQAVQTVNRPPATAPCCAPPAWPDLSVTFAANIGARLILRPCSSGHSRAPNQIRSQQQRQPRLEALFPSTLPRSSASAKGKASAPYEFGVKASATSRGRAGDAANGPFLPTAVGYNLRLILAWLKVLLCLILTALTQAFTTRVSTQISLLNERLHRSADCCGKKRLRRSPPTRRSLK